jgi:hypothetical protein
VLFDLHLYILYNIFVENERKIKSNMFKRELNKILPCLSLLSVVCGGEKAIRESKEDFANGTSVEFN